MAVQKLLIADPSEGYTDALKAVFQYEFELQVCHDGETALELLQSFTPDVLVINLHLPFKDGLTVLLQSAHKPQVILAITPLVDAYIERRAARAGVQYLLIMPTVESLRVRLMDMVTAQMHPECNLEGQTVVHLHSLNFHTHLDGYHQLRIGLPLYASNPSICLSKELYPAVAKHFKLPDPRTVEHSIRTAIEAAWKCRNPIVWQNYFPARADGTMPCPSNKRFFAAVAEKLEIQPCNLQLECYNNREGSSCQSLQEHREDAYETDQCSR